MEKSQKITEITTSDENYNAFEIILRCKELASNISANDLLNLDNKNATKIIELIKHLKNLELEIIEYEPNKVQA
jgi:hypothetical protein